MTHEELSELDAHFRYRYRVGIDQLEPTDVPGYWRDREDCGGLRGGCRHPLHTCLGNDRGSRHTYTFRDPPRDGFGRFASPSRTWRRHREYAQARRKGAG